MLSFSTLGGQNHVCANYVASSWWRCQAEFVFLLKLIFFMMSAHTWPNLHKQDFRQYLKRGVSSTLCLLLVVWTSTMIRTIPNCSSKWSLIIIYFVLEHVPNFKTYSQHCILLCTCIPMSIQYHKMDKWTRISIVVFRRTTLIKISPISPLPWKGWWWFENKNEMSCAIAFGIGTLITWKYSWKLMYTGR